MTGLVDREDKREPANDEIVSYEMLGVAKEEAKEPTDMPWLASQTFSRASTADVPLPPK